jgi:hypothetical protein
MINYSLLEDLSKKIHQIMGSSSSFEKKSGGLDLIEVMKQSELKIQNTESFYNYIDQNRQSNLKFASFDTDPVRKRNFLVSALSITEEEIKLTRNDSSFNESKKIINIINYIEIVCLISQYFSEPSRKEIYIKITYLIDSYESDITFLKSWFLILKAKILYELNYLDDSKKILDDAKKIYFENYSDFYFNLQNDYGKNYWGEEIIKLENKLNKNATS